LQKFYKVLSVKVDPAILTPARLPLIFVGVMYYSSLNSYEIWRQDSTEQHRTT